MYIQPSLNAQISIPRLLKIGHGTLGRIGKYLVDKGFSNLAVFWGEGLQEILGDSLAKGFEVNDIEVTFEQDVKYINIEEINKVAFNLPENTEIIVAIGGGKAMDFAKYCAYLLQKPFVAVPTSVSNDGFCSSHASLLVDGKRKNVKTNLPYGVIIDLKVIAHSPTVCLYSGIGDMISKVTALWDWKNACAKGYEQYNDIAALMSYQSLDILLIRRLTDVNSLEFQKGLTTSLLLSGMAMETADNYRPAYGSEHLISQALDDYAKRPRMHGIQVGSATYLCSLLQNNPNHEGLRDFLLATKFFEYVAQDPLDKADFMTAIRFAPMMKKNYYTILSNPENIERAYAYVEDDPILKQIVR